ncbi:hypothetical protein GCM10007301_51830 [Azorhizobium oxalatiphilum]|uniref:Uncharacterized protein n=1 Tax=Azorhizobium oxalatiphilum TaxID=980631 RepID=A0A917FHM7_9HYPH|nr:hypothetical protein GCM10007301_51830 [Azorhizobium oxalatiphilum]
MPPPPGVVGGERPALRPSFLRLRTVARPARTRFGKDAVIRAQVRALARALGRQAKIDPIDADGIGNFADATPPRVRPLA